MSGRTIGKLAREAGVNVETIRFYERRGLLKQPRLPVSGWRRYDDESLRRIRFIRRAQGLGFTLAEIEELLSLRATRSERTCERVRRKAVEKATQVEAKIQDLTGMRDALLELANACPEDSMTGCPLLETLDDPPAVH